MKPRTDHPPGYHGRYLRVDLGARDVRDVPIPADVLRRFIGGTGLGTWILLEETPDGVDPLVPEAPLAFVFSPLVGSPLTTSAKFAVLAKSPLTGRLNDSLSSSHFAIAGKKTGYDAIVIVGAADRPTCLVVEPDGVRFLDATAAWGRTIPEAAAHFKAALGPAYRLALIGPAGEKLVRFATISHDNRHAGRGGLGAVMGAKRLKALAVRGDRQVEFAHPERLVAYSRELSRRSFGPATAKYRELGTVSNLLVFNRLGTLPTRNFQAATFEHAAAIAPDALAGSHARTRASCAACTIGCEHIFEYSRPRSQAEPGNEILPGNEGNEGAPANGHGVRLEYESLFALGSLCGVSEPRVILQAAAFCDAWGLDTISAGATIAFAMECAERGLLDAPGLRFGDGPALLETLRAIGRRRGLGELLALGTRAAAAEIGGGAEDFAPHVKGLEIPGYEPRALGTLALGFAVGTRGADHNRSGAYQVDFSEAVDRLDVGPAAVNLAIDTENEAAVMDSLILCKFIRGVFDDRLAAMAEMLELVTGWDATAGELRAAAERIVTAKKWYNIRHGWTPAEDTLPRRFFEQPLPDGPGRGALLSEPKLRELIESYNLARGWTAEGWVPQERLVRSGLIESHSRELCRSAFPG